MNQNGIFGRVNVESVGLKNLFIYLYPKVIQIYTEHDSHPLQLALSWFRSVFPGDRGTQRQFLENICSGDDLRSRIFGIFVVKFFAGLPIPGFSSILKMV